LLRSFPDITNKNYHKTLSDEEPMIRKFSITIVTILLAVFGIGRVRGPVTYGHLACAVVSAQESPDDTASDPDADGDASTVPDKKTPPPSVIGDWDGVLYNGATPYVMQLDITKQKGSKVSGTWNASGYVSENSFKGTINGNDVMTFDLKVSGSCHLAGAGMLDGSSITTMTKDESCKGEKGTTGSFVVYLF